MGIRYFLIIFSILFIFPSQASEEFLLGDREFSESRFFPLSVLSCSKGNCTPGGMKKNQIVLTFDDGPNANTKKTLNVLAKHRVKGTFFVHIGAQSFNSSKAKRETMDRIYRDGHLIANHGRAMRPINGSTAGEIVIDYLMDTHNVIDQYLERGDLYLFRNPGGYWSKARARLLNQHAVLRNYIGPIYWNVGGANVWSNGMLVNSSDWECRRDKISATQCGDGYYRKILSNYRKGEGSLVLFHDIHSISASILDRLLSRLKNDGRRWEFIFVQDIPVVKNHQIYL